LRRAYRAAAAIWMLLNMLPRQYITLRDLHSLTVATQGGGETLSLEKDEIPKPLISTKFFDPSPFLTMTADTNNRELVLPD
jgi:hypothetical protein